MQHSRLVEWERNLKQMLDRLDDYLEDRYGDKYNLHPARPQRGRTANKSHDGLFDIVGSFTLGLGSDIGRGYIIDIRMSTLDHIPKEIENTIEAEAVEFLLERLPKFFPGKNLSVSMDNHVIKLHGDLSLGTL